MLWFLIKGTSMATFKGNRGTSACIQSYGYFQWAVKAHLSELYRGDSGGGGGGLELTIDLSIPPTFIKNTLRIQ